MPIFLNKGLRESMYRICAGISNFFFFIGVETLVCKCFLLSMFIVWYQVGLKLKMIYDGKFKKIKKKI